MKKRIKQYLMNRFISENLPKACYSSIELKKTPFGEKIIIHTSKPGIVVGRKGANISQLTENLKKKFKMENPQVEITEIENPFLDARSVAERIASSFERFGPKRFKSAGYRNLQAIMDAGAIGAEITISGRGVPSSRSRLWRFTAGHIKKSGDISESKIKRAKVIAHLKSGAVGIKVSILTPDIHIPDKIVFNSDKEAEKKPESSAEAKTEGKTELVEAKDAKQKSAEEKKEEAKKKKTSKSKKPKSKEKSKKKTKK